MAKKKKVLFFTYDFPVPITSGGKNRAYHMLKYGAKDLDVTLFSFYRDIPGNDAIAAIEELGIKNIRLFKRPLANFKSIAQNPFLAMQHLPALTKLANPLYSITKKLYYAPEVHRELIKTVTEEEIDVVHFESLYTAYYATSSLDSDVMQVFGTENIEYTLYQEYAKTAAKKMLIPFYLLEAEKIKRDEEKLLKTLHYTMAVSKEDADRVTQITSRPCMIIENGVDIKTFAFKKRSAPKKLSAQDKKVLLFVGNFSYFPNITAIKNFYTHVFSQLGDEFELRIIGRDVASLNIRDPRVTCDEYVEDIRDAYYSADMFVFPIKIGGGTNFKVVESMACGLPIIGYSDRLSTMGITHKNEAYFVKNGKEFVSAIKKFADDHKATELMTHRARRFVEDTYSWEVIGEKLNEYWKGLNEKN